MGESCTHSEHDVGICPRCGLCSHDLVLNGACFYCGADDLERSVKPKPAPVPDDFVPMTSLRRKG